MATSDAGSNRQGIDFLDKGSAIYIALGDAVSLVYSFPTTMLPAMHRVGGYAVGEHDRVFNGKIDPVGFEHGFDRLLTTQELVMGVIFGGEERGDIAYALRELHRNVHGTMPDGEKYHAWNPRLWKWFWMGSVSAYLNVYETFRGYPSAAFREETYQGFVQLGEQFGVKGMPDSYDEFIVEWPIERDLYMAATPEAHYLAEQLTSAISKPTFAQWIPRALWILLTLPLRRTLRLALLVAFVPEQNEMIGIRANKLDAFELMLHRLFWRLIPTSVTRKFVPVYFYLRRRFGNPSWRRHYSRESMSKHRVSHSAPAQCVHKAS